MKDKPFTPNGPIPGENYTSNTKNYAWHRKPEITDMDKAIEVSVKQLTQRESSYALLTMLQSGVTVVKAAQIFVMSGVSEGKWTVDFAILLAGPIAHIIKLMAEGYDIKYDMGLDDKPMSTINFVKAKAIDPAKALDVAEDVADQTEDIQEQAAGQAPADAPIDAGQPPVEGSPVPPTGGGFMSKPAPEQGM